MKGTDAVRPDLRGTRTLIAVGLAFSLATYPVFADDQSSTATTDPAASSSPTNGSTTLPWNPSTNTAGSTSSPDPSAPPRADEAPAPPASTGAENSSAVTPLTPTGTGHSSGTENPATSSSATQPSAGTHEVKQENNQSISSSSPRQPAHSATTGSATHPVQPAKPMVLYGRIEELSASTGATLQLGKMVAMTPMRDTSLDKKTPPKTLSGSAVQSFPMDFRGTWSGDLQVYSFNYDKTAWEFDRAETLKEYQILRPGTKGRTTATFYQTGNKIALQPCQVIFQGVMTGQEMMSQMQGSPLNALLGGNGANIMANMQMPAMYALHLGDLTSGRGVTGNELNSQLMKNTLRQLAPDVVEQNVVTRDSDRNPTTGKMKLGYSESVLRFTRQSSNRLYVQAATVSYRSDGRFQTKIILYGYLDRSSGGAYGANPYGGVNPYGGTNPYGNANPFGGLMPGGAGGGMGGGMQAIEKMMQQMTGGGR